MLNNFDTVKDERFTHLFSGEKVLKNDSRIQAIGSIDELNSLIGLISSHINDDFLKVELIQVQRQLFNVSSELSSKEINPKLISISNNDILALNNKISHLIELLPELNHFIIPGGSISASFAHHARTVCRRAERDIITLSQNEAINYNIVRFFNLLSNYLFNVARYCNFKLRIEENIKL